MNFCHLSSPRTDRFFPARSWIFALSALVFLTGCERPKLARDRPSPGLTAISDASTLREVLRGLGEEVSVSFIAPQDEALIERGRALVSLGRLPGSQDRKLSAYFYCIDCHDAEKAPSRLAETSDPEIALTFAIEQDRPLLPGPGLAGLVNREIFFTGEIAAGYEAPGEGIPRLDAAIQFCNTTVANGRQVPPPEMEALLAYLQSLEWKISDLGFRSADLAELKRRMLNPDEHPLIRAELKQRARPAAESTAGTIPEAPATGYRIEATPDPQKGGEIWARSCLHCHDADGASEHYFGDKPGTWAKLTAAFASGALYARLRGGSLPVAGGGARMPPFAKEKLSDAQIEHLRAYLETRENRILRNRTNLGVAPENEAD